MTLKTYLSSSLNSFIDAAIIRCAETGDTHHRFNLFDHKIRQTTGRQRLHDDVIIDFFKSFDINCITNSRTGIYTVNLDLNTCVLSPEQALEFTSAKTHYYSNN